MLALRRRLRVPTSRGEDGFALPLVIAVVLLVGAVVVGSAAFTVPTVIRSISLRDGTQAIDAAAAGIAQAQAQLSAWTACPAAGTSTLSDTLSSSPNVSTYNAQIVTTTASTGCTAVVTSTGTVTKGTKTVTRALRSTLTVTTGTTPAVTGAYAFYGKNLSTQIPRLDVSGSNAVVAIESTSNQTYSLNCNGGASTASLWIKGGGLQFDSSSCHVTGDVWVTGNVTAQNGGTIDGNVTSSGGSLNLGQNAGQAVAVGGTIKAAGSVIWATGCSASNRCYASQSGLSAPTVTAPVTFDTAAAQLQAWSAAGYTEQVAVPCTLSDDNARGTWVQNYLKAGTGKVLLTAACGINFQNAGTLTFTRDAVLLTSANITTTTLSLKSATAHTFYLIGTGGSSTFTFNGSVSSDSLLTTFMQAPIISFGGSVALYGQLYVTGAGSGNINSLDLEYRPVPLYGSVGGAAATTASAAWSLEREVAFP